MTTSPSLKGKIILITGATNGIGKETAQAAASMGAVTLITGRYRLKTMHTADEIIHQTGNQQVIPFVADLSVLEQVRRLAREVLERYNRLDILVNNAGAVFMHRQVT